MALQAPVTPHASMGTGIFTIDYEDILYGITVADTDQERNEYTALEYLIRNNYDIVVRSCEAAVKKILQEINQDFYSYIHDKIIISIRNFVQNTDIPEIASTHIDKFIKTDGILTQYDEPPDIRLVAMTWLCSEGHELSYTAAEIFPKNKENEVDPFLPPEKPTGRKKCKFIECDAPLIREIKEKREYSDYAFITIQERNDRVKEGKLPREIHVKLTGIEAIQRFYGVMEPGCYLVVNGPVRLASLKRLNAPIFVEASAVEIINDEYMMEDIPEIEELIQQDIPLNEMSAHFDKLIRSIAPSLEGMRTIKLAGLLALLGTDPKRREDGSRMRGELLYLIISSPARGKTDLLKFLSMIRPRSIYTQGRQSSAIGLTAGVGPADQSLAEMKTRKSSRILFGAIALAHGGMCCIDEMEKRKETDYQDISHTMDDWQHISLYKLGIHKDLPAYCSQIHACNPTSNNGLYDPLVPVSEQINFAEWLLSRYDLILAVHDDNSLASMDRFIDHVSKTYATVTLEKDYLAGGHRKITRDADNYSMVYLRHEIKYLRENYHPILDPNSAAWMMMMKFYNTYRTKNQLDRLDTENRLKYQNAGKNMFIPLLDNRKLNTLIRLAEASARGHRRNEVTTEDVIIATRLVRMAMDVICPNSRKGVDNIKVGTMGDKMMKSATKTVNRRLREEMNRRQGLAKKFNKYIISVTFQQCMECHGKGIIREGGSGGACQSCDGVGGSYNNISYQSIMMMSDVLKKDGFTEADIVENLQIFVAGGILSQKEPTLYGVEKNLKDPEIWKALEQQLRFQMGENDVDEEDNSSYDEEDSDSDQGVEYDDSVHAQSQKTLDIDLDKPIYSKS